MLKNSEDSGFNLAWGFLGEKIPASIGNWTMHYVMQKEDTTKGITKSATLISKTPYCNTAVDDTKPANHENTYIGQWTESKGKNHTKKDAAKNSRFTAKNLLCSDGFSNEIGGDFFSKDFRYIEI